LPITIPPFNQYQAPIVPLRGLWNATPVEGDKFITAEIDWLVTTTQQAVQFAVSANSPVAFSQIVALAIDNSRCGVDVDFVFSDSGFVLTVPAHNQAVNPVFTNGLMFYVVANGAVVGDVTTFQVLNSMPPPVYIAPSVEQNHASVSGVALVNGSMPVIASGINGVVNSISITIDAVSGAGGGAAQVSLIDGQGRFVWFTAPTLPASASNTFTYNPSGLSVRFVNGLNLSIASNSFTAGTVYCNVYYSTP
jgi:hypothetical protein